MSRTKRIAALTALVMQWATSASAAPKVVLVHGLQVGQLRNATHITDLTALKGQATNYWSGYWLNQIAQADREQGSSPGTHKTD